MSNYTVTHIHTMYSNGTTNIDSVTNYSEYIKRAKELGMKAIAFTEHGNIFNWYKKKVECETNGIKYIHATEMYITENKDNKIRDNYHCCLYAKNYDGFLELNNLMSNASNREDGHFYYTPRITFEELVNTSNNILVTTACLGGILNKAKENKELYDRYVSFLKENKDRCFLEVQHHNVLDQIEYNKELYILSKETGVRLIAGTDTHALNDTHIKGRSILQKAKNVYFEDEEGWDLTFKSYSELVECYEVQKSIPREAYLEAINNTNVLSDMVEEYSIDKSAKYPKLYDNPEVEFKKKIIEGIKSRGINKLPNFESEYLPRINEEYEVYKKLDTIDYMLLQEKITTDCGNQGDVKQGFGRGSVGGSVIAYLLGITQMDSIKHNLNFYRFLNPDRVSLADIDTDQGEKDRDFVKNYIFNMENVYCSEIITFNTVALKGGIRDVGRALEIPLSKIDDICKNLEDKEELYRKQYKELFEYVDIINGTIVSIGSHPAGIIVSPIPLDTNLGLCTLSGNDNPVCCLDMKAVDSLNYIKLDILSLDTISIINETCKLAGIERLTPDNIDIEDDATWEGIKNDTTAIFQMESLLAHKCLETMLDEKVLTKIKKTNPNITRLDIMMFVNAAIRPAGASFRDKAIVGEFNKTGIKELDEMLYDTLGYVLLQEQIMEFLVKFCDYSQAESDTIRRAIGKKTGTETLLPEIKERFLDYAPRKYNISMDLAVKVIDPFIQTVKDASNYGFSKNHNSPYAYTGYIAGYLRTHYPLEFCCAALNTWIGKQDKTVNLTEYMAKNNIRLENPKFRYSKAEYFFDKTSDTIYKGIDSIKYLNKNIGEYLYQIRDNEYSSFTDLLVELSTVMDSRQLEILIKLDFFVEFGKIKKLLAIKDNFNNFYSKKQFKKEEFSHLIDILREVSNKESEKLFKEVDTLKLCRYLEENTQDLDVDFSEKFKAHTEYMGSCNITDTSLGKRACIVTEIVDNGKYTPRITLYCMSNGRTQTMKVKRMLLNSIQIEQYDCIYVGTIEEKPKSKLVEGKWVKSSETEKWLTKYHIL